MVAAGRSVLGAGESARESASPTEEGLTAEGLTDGGGAAKAR